MDVSTEEGCLDALRSSLKTGQWDPEVVSKLRASCTTPTLDFSIIHNWKGFPGGGWWLLLRLVQCCPIGDIVLDIIFILNDVPSTMDDCSILLDMAIIPVLIEKIYDEGDAEFSPLTMQIKEESARGLGILSTHCAEFCSKVHRSIMPVATLILDAHTNHYDRRRCHITHVLSKMCNPIPPGQVEDIMKYFTDVLTSVVSARKAGDVEEHGEVEKEIIDILWGISYVTDGDIYRHFGSQLMPLIVGVLSVPAGKVEPGYGDAPVVERLVPCEQMAYAMEYLPRVELERLCMLNSDIWNCCVCANRRLYNRVRSTVCHNRKVRLPAVRIIGNVMAGDDEETQAAIDCGALSVMEGIVASLRPMDATNYDMDASYEWKELCWILSNVAAGSDDQIRLVLKSNIFYNFVMEALLMSGSEPVKKEAAYVVGSAMCCLCEDTRPAISPDEMSLGWLAAVFGYFASAPIEIQSLCHSVVDAVMRVRPQLPTPLSTIRDLVSTDSTPESLQRYADTFTRDDCVGSTPDKLTTLMRDHVLPTLYAMGKLDGNENFISDVVGSGVEVAGSEVDTDV